MSYTTDYAQIAIEAAEVAEAAAYERDDVQATLAALAIAERAEQQAQAQAAAATRDLAGDISNAQIIADALAVASVAREYAEKARAAVAYAQSV